MRNTIIVALMLAIGLPLLAACTTVGMDEEGILSVTVSPLVGLDRLQKSEAAISARLDAADDAIKTVVSAEVAAGLEAAEKRYETTAGELAEEDGKNRNWVYLGLGLAGLGGLGLAETKRRGKVAVKKADEKIADRVALAADIADKMSGNTPTPESV